jgi:hypothetical protein
LLHAKADCPMTFIPFLIVPLILYNVFAFGFMGGADADPWAAVLISFNMVSGAPFELRLGAMLILVALLLLFFEVLKSTRIGSITIWDHMLSTFVFVAYLLEFVLVPAAATDLFFVLTAIALIDLLAGFAVSLRTATRDVAINGGDFPG